LEVECLGACVNAPVIQVNDDFYEDLDADSTVKLIDDLKAGKKPPMGSATGRQTSAPEGGANTLTTLSYGGGKR
jgi:NADH-quinone oxidoreductase subunit E